MTRPKKLLVVVLMVVAAILLWRNAALPEPAAGADAPATETTRRSLSHTAGAEQQDGFAISGTVEAANGVLGAVQIIREGEDERVETSAAEDGRFSLWVPGPGHLRTEPTAYPSTIRVNWAVDDLRFVFPELCPVAARALTPAGEPAAGVSVLVMVEAEGVQQSFGVYGPENLAETLITDEDGRLPMDNIPCGVAHLHVSDPSWLNTRHTIDTPVEKSATLQLTAPFWVYGIVSDEAGAPIEGVVYDSLSRLSTTEPTGPDGIYRIQAIPGETLTMDLRREGYLPRAAR